MGLARPLTALATLLGISLGGGYVVYDVHTGRAENQAYIEAVAADSDTSIPVKIAMVMGAFYESSNRHIGKPYIDKNGKGRPLTVCNGVTGAGVVAGRYYSPEDCYNLEKRRYILTESSMKILTPNWDSGTEFQQASLIDFGWNKGTSAYSTSTMRRKVLSGDWVGACRENPKWRLGTVNGKKVVLPGLVVRGDSNSELCESWTMEIKDG